MSPNNIPTQDANQPACESYLIIGGGTPLGESLVKLLLCQRKDANIAILGAHALPSAQAEHFPNQVRVFVEDMQSQKRLLAVLESTQPTCIIHTGTLSTTDSMRILYPSPTDPPLSAKNPNPSMAVIKAVCTAQINGTQNLLSAMAEFGVPKQRLVYVSSAGIVFNGKERPNLCEADAPYLKRCWKEDYEGRAKSERLVLEWNGQNGWTTAAIRPAMSYGRVCKIRPSISFANPLYRRTPQDFRTLARQDGLIHIDNNKRLVDRTFTDNTAHACLLAADRLSPDHRQHTSTAGRAFFITDCEARPIWDFTRDVRAAVAHAIPPNPTTLSGATLLAGAGLSSFRFWRSKKKTSEAPKNNVALNYAMCVTRTYDISRAKEVLEYSPVVSYDEGVRLTAEWYLERQLKLCRARQPVVASQTNPPPYAGKDAGN
ncbi:hypothetical protein FB45DRAFT_873447 [Roridomyces roridus]|uniref:3-beta hydroxysteroid dehydrogenase/isomerase domain-containing protein n=1 Tax=Roridomyces roridus TaxID=1738132 RepID=A0AAD7BAN7_9AGAR|nr:hypothetical protein FB45DRAFT_873447 [Roridomyces roridus]